MRRRILSLVLAVLTSLTLCVPALAGSETDMPLETGGPAGGSAAEPMEAAAPAAVPEATEGENDGGEDLIPEETCTPPLLRQLNSRKKNIPPLSSRITKKFKLQSPLMG